MLLAYRITKQKYIKDLSGTGARITGGRWNKKGWPVVYTASTPELALLEYSVHMNPMKIPRSVFIATIEINSKSIEEVHVDDLPKSWNKHPYRFHLPEIGTAWLLANSSLVLKVPSAIMPLSKNILINPGHREMKKVKVKLVNEIAYNPRIKMK